MRIDCEQCGAAYNIDDALITERGVRAQCPKCGHQKVVKKAAGAAPAANPFGAPAAGPFGAPSGAPGGNPFGAPSDGATRPNAPNPFAAPTQPSGNPFGAATQGSSNPFGAPTGAPTQPSGNPFGAPSTASAPNPFGAPSAAPTQPSGNPFGAPSAAPTQPSASPFASAPDPFAGMSAAPAAVANPFAAAAAAPAPAPTPFGGSVSDPFGLSSSPGSSPFNPAGAPPAAPPSPPPAASMFGAPGSSIGHDPSDVVNLAPNPAGGPPPRATADPFAALGATVPPSPPPAAPKDPFEALAQKSVRPAMGGGAAAPAPSAGAVDDPFAKLDLGGPRIADTPAQPSGWRVKTRAGMDAEMDLASLREMVKNGTVSATDEAAPIGQPLKAVSQWPLLQTAPTATSPPKVAGARARSAGGGGIPRAALVVGAVVLAGAVVGGIMVVKPELFESTTDAGVNPLRRAKPTWAKQFPDVSGTAADHLNAGRQQMLQDTAAGYRKADEELRQALLVDIGNVDAIAAWVENFANLPAVKSDIEQANLADEAIAFAARKQPESTDVMRAQAALKLAHGDIDGAQKVLTASTQKAPNDVAAFVVLARSHLDRNAQDTLDILETQVKPKNKELKAALVVEGGALRRLGNFKGARDVLNARLASDPQNTGALKELAKLELDIGNPEEAISALTRLLQAEERDVDAHLMRAKIAYQIGGVADGLKRADAFLDEVLAKHESAAGELLLPVLAHSAYVKAELGDLEKSLALAERARATDANFAPGLFVLGRILAAKGDADGAKKALEAGVRAAQARDSFYEPSVRAQLAVVQAATGDTANAIRNFEQVIEYDPRDTRAHFGLAATYMRTDKATQAMTIMRRALQNDPSYQVDRRVLTDYPTSPTDLVKLADVFRDAKIPNDDPSLAALKMAAEGTIRYHAGQRAEAKTLFEDTLREDRFNHAALFHLGVIAIDEGLAAEAKRKLGLAIQTTGKGHAMTQLYMARAELALGENEGARKRLTDLLSEEATLVAAQYSLAMSLRALSLEGQATEELKKVVKADQDFTPAKRALVQ